MKILHVVAGLPPGGGIGEAVPALCSHLQRLGHEVVLASVARPGVALPAVAAQAGVRVVRFRPSWPQFLYFSWAMAFGLGRLAREADVVHVHSNWTFPVWRACRGALHARKPLVMTPHGCLDPVRLRHAAWKKRLAGWIDRYFMRRASVIQATCEAEKGWVEAFLGGRVGGEGGHGARCRRIVMIPNGVAAEAFAGPADPAALESRWPGCRGLRVALFLSRLHPLKGLPLLLEAWASVPHEGWRLVVAGGDEAGHEAEARALAAALGVLESVVFAGPLYGAAKAEVMKAADLFVLPTRSENFGLAVAEALAAGVPVITTKGAPWAELESCRCGWWVDIGAAPLAAALREAMGLTDAQRRAMGESGRRLVEQKYRWKQVAEAMARVYDDLAEQSV